MTTEITLALAYSANFTLIYWLSPLSKIFPEWSIPVVFLLLFILSFCLFVTIGKKIDRQKN
jgi:hypothetical protein